MIREGPLAHVVAGTKQQAGANDLDALAGNGTTSPSANSLYPLAHPEQPTGPHLHMADGNLTNLIAITEELPA